MSLLRSFTALGLLACSTATPLPAALPAEPTPEQAASHPDGPGAASEPDSLATPSVASPSAPGTPAMEGPPRITELAMPGEPAALLVDGQGNTPIIYLHGRCGDPTAFSAWAGVGAKHGVIVSLRGEVRCKSGVRSRFSEDIKKLDARITRTLERASDELGRKLDLDHRLVVGYSQGALRAESLATRFPERYPRAILIAGPRAPRATSLTKTEAVLLMAGDRDVRKPLRDAAERLASRGQRARFLLLPDARHGEYGSDPERIFEEAWAWLGPETDAK